MVRPFRPAHNWGNVKAYRPERIIMPTDVALQIAPPRSKVAKWLRREKRARHIAERQWWPGLHTRWWMEGQER